MTTLDNRPADSEDGEVEPSTLYIVPTPIGNLGDMSPRGRAILAGVDLIAAEDTRTTRQLLAALGMSVRARLVSYHDHNARQRAPAIAREMAEGGISAALVSDAGTPACSDPGFRLVVACVEAGLRVVPLPGPAAFLCALVASGLPTDRFLFLGFLPSSSGKRQHHLEEVRRQSATLCLYESPRRLVEVLRDALEILGDRRACVAREVTKRYEEFLRGPLSALIEILAARDAIRGEVVLIIEGDVAPPQEGAQNAEALRLIDTLRGLDTPPNAIKKIVAAHTGMSPREVYALMLG